jgi:hypothetical protein
LRKQNDSRNNQNQKLGSAKQMRKIIDRPLNHNNNDRNIQVTLYMRKNYPYGRSKKRPDSGVTHFMFWRFDYVI